MTYIEKYKENQERVKQYDLFLCEIHNLDDRVKLEREIIRLVDENKFISSLTPGEAKNNIRTCPVKLVSRINRPEGITGDRLAKAAVAYS